MNADVRHRAERLLRWYPREWRARYGEEFTELLVAELEERPRSLRRDVDLARTGLTARLAAAGLGGQPLGSDGSGRRSLATLVAALSIFSVVAVALWAQLTIGWQWAPPATRATSLAMVVMSLGILVVGVTVPSRHRSGGLARHCGRSQSGGATTSARSASWSGASSFSSWGPTTSPTAGRARGAILGPTRESCPAASRRTPGRRPSS